MRFGNDPATSVLDADCKAHELDNLYVVDTSFFPSIGAVNPALTAMANALRVGDHLASRLDDPDRTGGPRPGAGLKPSSHGVRQPPTPAVMASAPPGPPGARGVALDRPGRVEQRLHDPPGLLDRRPARLNRVLSPTHRGVQQDLVRRRPLAALGRRTPCRARSARSGPRSARWASTWKPDAGGGVELDDQLVGLGSWPAGQNPSCGGRLKTSRSSVWVTGSRLPVRMKNGTPAQRQFSMSSRSAAYVSVVDPAATPSMSLVAVVLTADVVGRVGLDDGAEQRDLRLLDGVQVAARRAAPSPRPRRPASGG